VTPLSAFEDLPAWLSHLETLHPKTIDLGLARIRTVAERLGVLGGDVPTIIVAGTNGKGTTVAALQSLLRQLGFSVGTYTSPHLIDFNERIVVDGQPAPDSRILDAFAEIESARSEITLSYFEFATLAALLVFKQSAVDWQVLEVGLGGRLDAVNCVDADLAIITSIGIDHTEWLGETREAIAPEKAGVARADKPVIVAESALPDTLLPALNTIGAVPWVIGRDWHLNQWSLVLPDGQQISLPPSASLQPSNLSAAVIALNALGLKPSQEQVNAAFKALAVAGRQFRLHHRGREWWLDVAHNRESVAALVSSITASPATGATHLVFGAMVDKPLRDMIESASKLSSAWHLPNNQAGDRAALPADLAKLVRTVDHSATLMLYDTPLLAYEGVHEVASPGDRIIVFGSFVTVGEQMKLLQRHA